MPKGGVGWGISAIPEGLPITQMVVVNATDSNFLPQLQFTHRARADQRMGGGGERRGMGGGGQR